MARIISVKKLWRGWLRSESPRRRVLNWSSPDRAGLVIVCFVVALISSIHLLQVPDISPGMPAPQDELAPKDALVQYRNTQIQQDPEVIQRPIFVQVIDDNKSNDLKINLGAKLQELEQVANKGETDRIGPVNLTKKEQKWLISRTKSSKINWVKEVKISADRMLSQGLVKSIGFDQLREASSLQLSKLGTKESPPRTLGSKLIAKTFHGRSNLTKDSVLQGLLEDTINKQVPPIKVRSGDVITRKGEKIKPEEYVVLEHFNLVSKSPRLIPFLGTFIEALVACIVLLLIMRRERPCLQARHGFLALGLIFIAQLIAQISKVIVGLTISPLVILIPPTLLLSQGLGSTTALSWLATTSLLWQIPIEGIGEGKFIIAWVVAAVMALQAGRMRSRAQLLQMTFLLPFGGLLGEWFFLRERDIPNSSDELVYEAIVLGSMLMLTILLIPIVETTFGLITRARLMELADHERPLLRRLSLEAPGTFEHTLIICGLAEEGARTIGADVDLIKTGALYHDVGKLHAPEWFIENQTAGENPHETINNPLNSAEILQAHVDEGLKLARKHRLPRPIADFIPEHQGTLKMGYFLHKAKIIDPLISEKLFRYKGPIPRSRETAILMLADGCEAALRSLDQKTSDKEACETVKRVVESRQIDGQLKESSLTRAEVELVIRAFVRVWRRMRHHRIAYPINSNN